MGGSYMINKLCKYLAMQCCLTVDCVMLEEVLQLLSEDSLKFSVSSMNTAKMKKDCIVWFYGGVLGEEATLAPVM